MVVGTGVLQRAVADCHGAGASGSKITTVSWAAVSPGLPGTWGGATVMLVVFACCVLRVQNVGSLRWHISAIAVIARAWTVRHSDGGRWSGPAPSRQHVRSEALSVKRMLADVGKALCIAVIRCVLMCDVDGHCAMWWTVPAMVPAGQWLHIGVSCWNASGPSSRRVAMYARAWFGGAAMIAGVGPQEWRWAAISAERGVDDSTLRCHLAACALRAAERSRPFAK